MSTVVEARRQGHCLTLHINRPERRNALNPEVIQRLRQELAQADADKDIRVVIITGTGKEAFCAGADLQGSAFQFDYASPSNGYADLLRQAYAMTTPLIAKVNGACMAGGMGLLAMCNLAIAAPHAVFGLPEVRVGVFPMQVLSVLQGVIPDRVLHHLCLTGQSMTAQEAQIHGLVNTVADDLDAATEVCVNQLLANAPAALRRGMYAIKHARHMTFEQSIAFTESQIGLMALTRDAREGLSAFKEKRQPQWTGE